MNDLRLPAGIVALGPEASDTTRALMRAAEDRQAAEAEAALEEALRAVPWPVRGVVKKVLLG